ncbi:MAG: class II D-tagatose-bisphosphate aldolase, non-catalytic subunit [Desulfobacterales bacterium]|nr:class II D-tagatose-bisphosphate aldolase, non-catalytic subunit [Desulfobacterales bacterium]
MLERVMTAAPEHWRSHYQRHRGRAPSHALLQHA